MTFLCPCWLRPICLATAFTLAGAPGMATADTPGNAITRAARHWERALDARIGVSVLDTGTGQSWGYHAEQRFPMASTFKAFACGALLQAGPTAMDSTAEIRQTDVLDYAPVTRDLVGQHLPAYELCAIALRTSDNTAANKVLEILGGPRAVTRFLRTAGDAVTRLDRNEPTLTEGTPGDVRDTTTPRAAAHTLAALALGPALPRAASAQLIAWLAADAVAGPLLRASLPAGWQIADRSGAGRHGTRGIIAVVWPPQRSPVVIAIYITQTHASMQARNGAIAELGRVIFHAVSHAARHE